MNGCKPPEGLEESPSRAFSFTNGVLRAFILVQREEPSNGRGLTQKVDDWLPCAIDLRVVSSIKQSGFEDGAKHTSLFSGDNFLGEFDVPFYDLYPQWVCYVGVHDRMSSLSP